MKFRPARVDDCARIAALYRISSDGVADYIWSRCGGNLKMIASRPLLYASTGRIAGP